jgi:transcriptional regulator with XRE-family HTH domain
MRVGKKAKLAIKPKSRSTGSFDVHFGEKLRARRLMMDPKVSQADLGKAIGLTFQQVQKYEKGNNRMSAAMMVQIAAALKVNVQYFFEELPRSAKNGKEIKTPDRDVSCSARSSPDRRIPKSEKRQIARGSRRSSASACSSLRLWPLGSPPP